jgi:hypothetical protein
MVIIKKYRNIWSTGHAVRMGDTRKHENLLETFSRKAEKKTGGHLMIRLRKWDCECGRGTKVPEDYRRSRDLVGFMAVWKFWVLVPGFFIYSFNSLISLLILGDKTMHKIKSAISGLWAKCSKWLLYGTVQIMCCVNWYTFRKEERRKSSLQIRISHKWEYSVATGRHHVLLQQLWTKESALVE